MKKNLKSLLFIVALIISIVPVSYAFAKDGDRSENERIESSSDDSNNENESEDENKNDSDSNDDSKNDDSSNDSDSDKDDDSKDDSNDDSNDDSGKDDSNDDDVKNITGDQHKSAVAKFVESLEKIADKDKKVGEQVREIAKAQQEMDESIADAIDKVKKRSKFATFLIGTDYKNIGKIRSESVKTDQRIVKLETLAGEAATLEIKETLNKEIQAIKDEQLKLDNFIKVNEQTFSLFGWFAKLFAN
jgi:cytoskeletal protein RodZ